MSKYYSSITRSARKNPPTARGHESTGVSAYCASWNGRIAVDIWTGSDGAEMFTVHMEPHHGCGDKMELASGIVGDCSSVTTSGWNMRKLVNFVADRYQEFDQKEVA